MKKLLLMGVALLAFACSKDNEDKGNNGGNKVNLIGTVWEHSSSIETTTLTFTSESTVIGDFVDHYSPEYNETITGSYIYDHPSISVTFDGDTENGTVSDNKIRFKIGSETITFTKKATVGTAEEYEVDLEPNTNEPWEWAYISLADGTVVAEDAGWDIAILRYKFAEMAIRTPFDEEELPIKYMVTGQGMPSIGEKNIVWSGIEAVDFSLETMPPVYTELPAHEFLSADEQHTYSVQFTAYDSTSGTLTMTVEEV